MEMGDFPEFAWRAHTGNASAAVRPDQQTQPGRQREAGVKLEPGAASQIALRSVAGFFAPSLQAMEEVDFLLSPALLTQEALLIQDLLSCHSGGHLSRVPVNARGVEFDTIITLEEKNAHQRLALFARYWVTPFSYRMAVVWSEPHSQSLSFPVGPFGLWVTSTPQSFGIGQEADPGAEATFQKPVGPREVLRYMFGQYPASNMRFAEPDFLPVWQFASSLAGVQLAQGTKEEVVDLPLLEGTAKSVQDVATLRLTSRTGRVISIQFLDSLRNALKKARYEYDEKSKLPELRRQEFILAERTILFGFRGEGVKVVVNGSTNVFRDLPLRHFKGGQRCSVLYEEIVLEKDALTVPVSMEVRSGGTNALWGSVKFMDFTRLRAQPGGPASFGGQFGRFKQHLVDYVSLIGKYGHSQPSRISASDSQQIASIRDWVETHPGEEERTIGGRLRRLGLIMDLSRLLGDAPSLRRAYGEYLATVSGSDLQELLLPGGYAVIDTLVRLGRPEEATCLMGNWLDRVMATLDLDTIERFAADGLKRKAFWGMAQLLERSLAQPDAPLAKRFEMQAERCLALHQMQQALSTPRSATNMTVSVQAKWASVSVDTNRLAELAACSKDETLRLFALLESPNAAQKSLLAEVKSTHGAPKPAASRP